MRRFYPVIAGVFWTVVACAALWLLATEPDGYVRLGYTAIVLLAIPLAAGGWVRTWRRGPARNLVRRVDDALIIAPPGRLASALTGLSHLSQAAAYALAAYLAIRLPKAATTWLLVGIAPVLAIVRAYGARRLLWALRSPPGIRLDRTGVALTSWERPIAWSEIVAADLTADALVLKRRSSPAEEEAREVRIAFAAKLTDEDQRAIRDLLERSVPAA